jgi:hypothetical protein
VSSLDEDSGAEVAALDEADTDLESSDFDLALGEEDIAADEESGSQVVALEEEEADDAAATVTTRRAGIALEDEEAMDEMLGDEVVEEEEEEPAARRATAPAAAATAAPAPWGPLPAILLFPAVILLFLGGLMGFELIRGMWGYQNSQKIPGLLTDPISRLFPGTEDWPK